jgi:hypothetical protein
MSVKDLPALVGPDNISLFLQRLEAMRERVQVLGGHRGDQLDHAITWRDAIASGLATVEFKPGGSGAPGPAGTPGPAGPPGTGPTPDLTPPPTPTGLQTTATFSNIIIEWDPATYTQGHGHGQTNIYGATWNGTGTPPTFADAVMIGSAPGALTIYAHPTALGVNWHIWIKWQTKDGVESTSPAGGTNGSEATTGKIGTADLGSLIVQATNLANGSVTAAKIAAAAVDKTKFASGITPVEILDVLPTIGNFRGRTALLTTDNKLYRFNGTAWTKAVDGADLVVNSVTTGSIAAGAIKAQQIDVGAIIASKLVVQNRDAADPDPAFYDVSFWTNGGAAYPPGVGVGENVGWPVKRTLVFASTGGNFDFTTQFFPMELGATYRFKVTMFVASAVGGEFSAYAHFPQQVWFPLGATSGTSAVTGLPKFNLSTRDVWYTFTGTYTNSATLLSTVNPNNRTQFRFAGNLTGGNLHIAIEMVRVADADLIVDGAVIASKIAAGAIAVGSAAIENGAIRNALIANLAVDDAKIASMSVAKLIAGSISVGAYIQSTNYVSGSAGWRIDGAGGAEFSFGMIRGTLLASQVSANLITATMIDSRNLTIKDGSGNIIFGASQNLDWGRIAGAAKPQGWRVVSQGLGATGVPAGAGLYNADTGAQVFGAVRSYMLAQWRRSDGALDFAQTYDVYNSGEVTAGRGAAQLAAQMNLIASDHIFALYTFDEPANLRLTGGLPAAIYRCGGTPGKFESTGFAGRGAYLLIGIGGCGPGNAFYEGYAGSGADTGGDGPDNAWLDVTFYIANGNPIVSGAGLGGFQINGSNISTYIASAAISAAYISSLSVGLLSTAINGGASSGARIEMASNVIKVFDSSNVVRVKLGNLA